MRKTQTEMARDFIELHRGPKILVLPNAWDVASARIFEDAGFPAIGTSSAGVAFSLGYPDGEKIPREEMLAVVRRIAKAVDVPVTADVEAGFGSTPEEVADTARAVIAAGAVGMNLEDGVEGKPEFLADVNRQKEIIRAVLEAAEAAGVPFVLNARTDIFLYGIGPAETRLARAIERLNAYHAAGAQSLFAPGVKDKRNHRAVGARSCRTVEHPGNRGHAAGCGTAATRRRARERRIRDRCAPRLVFLGAWLANFTRKVFSP